MRTDPEPPQRAKRSASATIEIRRLYWRERVPAKELAERYGLDVGYMTSKIINQPLEALNA